MNKIKSLVLGSAATLAAIGGAQAADLPVKAKAVEYVKVCSLYGAGFYYIPGTDTCIRLGGYLRAEVTFNGSPSDNAYISGIGGAHDVNTNQYQTRARIMVNLDTRTATEYGVVRTFAAFGPQFSTTGTNGTNAVTSGTNGAVNAIAPESTADTQANGGMRVEAAFVQFAGFTFGRSASAYALPWNGAPGNLDSNLLGGPNYDAGVNNVQYTWQFGNGVSASIGLDEQSAANRTQVINATAGISASGAQTSQNPYATNLFGYYGGTSAPDIVGSIRLDQAWGLLQFSAAAHQVTGSYYGAAVAPGAGKEIVGTPDDKWGFAVTAALQIKNLPTGPGDDIKISGTYAQGATRYVFGASGQPYTNFAVFGNGNGATYNSYAVGTVSDALYAGTASNSATATGLQLTESYGFNGAFNHNWNKNWATSLFGSYSVINYNSTATTAYCAAYALGTGAVATCNPDFKVSQLGLLTTWTPVKNLTFGAEALWTHVDTGFSGTTGATFAPGGSSGSIPKPNGAYNFRDQDVFSGLLRVQRNF